MLVLSRKRYERIVIGNNIEIVVIDVQGGRVKLGFTAPDDVRIRRLEIPARVTTKRSFDAKARANFEREQENLSLLVN